MAENAGASSMSAASIKEPVIVFGHALFYAWYLMVACTLSVGYPAHDAVFPPSFAQLAMLVGTAMATVALSHGTPAGFFGRKYYNKATSIASLAMGCLSSLLVAIDAESGGHQALFALLLFVSGVGVVYFFSAWEDLAMECGPSNPILSTAASFTLGSLLFAVSFLFPLRLAAVLSLLFLGSSAGMIMVVGRTAHKGEEDAVELSFEGDDAEVDRPASSRTAQLRANILFFLVSLCSGMVLALCSSTSQELLGKSFFVGAVLCAVALGLFWMTKRIVSVETLETLDAVVIVMAFVLVLAVRTEDMGAVSTCAVLAMWTVFRAFNGGLNMNSAIRLGQPSVRRVASSNISLNVGLPVGCLVACLMLRFGLSEDVLIAVLTALTLLLVAFCFVAGPYNRNGQAPESADGGSRSFEELMQKCMLVSEAYRLSPREGEILCYLARGRSSKRIADDLVVSEHTVKSHVYRIYKKMGVHTRQELIDMVEAGSAADGFSR